MPTYLIIFLQDQVLRQSFQSNLVNKQGIKRQQMIYCLAIGSILLLIIQVIVVMQFSKRISEPISQLT